MTQNVGGKCHSTVPRLTAGQFVQVDHRGVDGRGASPRLDGDPCPSAEFGEAGGSVAVLGVPQLGVVKCGLTLLGGEPMENTDGLTQIVQNVKQAMPDKSVWVYSGFTYDEIIQDPQKKALLDVCDVLVDGPFVDDLKDPGLYFRGSSNQRVIDLKATRTSGQITLVWPDGR